MKRGKTTKTVNGLVILAALSMQLHAGAAVAEDDSMSSVDTSKWLCEDCPFEEGFSGTIDFGVGTVSEDSFKFGEYNGLNDKGGFLVGNVLARYRDKDADFLDMSITDLGLDSRSLSIDGGRQGKYKLWLRYDQIPHNISDTAATPFLGTGSDTLTLPGGWVRAGTTGGMTSLDASLNDIELKTERKRFDLGGALIPHPRWEYAVNFRHETKEGMKAGAGSFYFNATQLIEPVDYVTDAMDVSAAYNGNKGQLRLAYYASLFHNKNESLTWDNPYTSVVAGADRGQLALPPDNQFHQIVLSAGYQFTDRTHAAGDIAYGRMTQDEDFLATTLTPSPEPLPSSGPPALPRNSLDGKVNTLNADLKIVSSLTDKLRLNAVYAYSDRDNKTPQAAYTWVTTDSFVNPVTRTNLPYSFTRNTIKLGADYRVPQGVKLSGGYDYITHERDYQEVDKTKQETLWAKASYRIKYYADLTIKGAHAKRDASSYEVVPEIDGPENPLLRKYNMADRTRDTAGVSAGFNPHERINLGLQADYAWDDYTHSSVGLIESEEATFTGDVSIMFSRKTNLNFFFTLEIIESDQAGSQAFSTPDWFAENKDRINTAGIGVKYNLIENKLDIGADFVLSNSEGDIDMTPSTSDFPTLKTRLDSTKLYATYRLKDKVSLRAAYWHETYDSDDWAIDNVTESTIPNVLSLGQENPSYSVNTATFSVQYEF